MVKNSIRENVHKLEQCAELHSHGYRPVLFVRSENKAAPALYESCGFSVCGDYAISYY